MVNTDILKEYLPTPLRGEELEQKHIILILKRENEDSERLKRENWDLLSAFIMQMAHS